MKEVSVTHISRWRYVPPNAITCLGILFAWVAMTRALSGAIVAAVWWGLLVTLTDKLDGIVARALRATSSFGVELDSLADLVAFGVVPATIVYALFSVHAELGWSSGSARVALLGICGAYVIAAALRLARFNVQAPSAQTDYFIGIPSTMAAAIFLALLAVLLKYADPLNSQLGTFDSIRIPGVHTLTILSAAPWVLLAFAVSMLSPLRVPKLGKADSNVANAIIVALVVIGYTVGVCRILPEYLLAGGVAYLTRCVLFHTLRWDKSSSMS